MDTKNQGLVDFQKQMHVSMSTKNFIGLSVLSISFYMYYWSLNFLKIINRIKGTTIVPVSHLLIVISVTSWSSTDIFSDFVIGLAESSGAGGANAGFVASLFNFCVLLAIIVFNAIISLKLAGAVQEELEKYGYTKAFSKPLVAILSFYYIYYRLHTLLDTPKATLPTSTAPNKFDKIEKLAQLKADGSITEEEFQTEKAKILHETESN